MARSSNRVSAFTSHRGRKTKKVLIMLAVATTVLFFTNALRGGSEGDVPREERSSRALAEDQEETEPDVAAPIPRPFALPVQGGPQDVESGDVYGEALDNSDDSPGAGSDDEEDEEEDATEELKQSDSYRSAVQVTTEFAEAYGTHSYRDDPEEWVESLPHLEKSAKASLLKSVKSTWPELVYRKSSSKASAVAQSVTPIYSREGGAKIQLSVQVTKQTSYEGDSAYSADAYAVTLEQASSGKGWVVIDVS